MKVRIGDEKDGLARQTVLEGVDCALVHVENDDDSDAVGHGCRARSDLDVYGLLGVNVAGQAINEDGRGLVFV